VSFSPDGQLLASGSKDESIKLWNVQSGACVRTLADHTDCTFSVSFSPDGQLLASVGGMAGGRLSVNLRHCCSTDWSFVGVLEKCRGFELVPTDSQTVARCEGRV